MVRAYYDVESGKIKNCVVGSREWWHEKGHKHLVEDTWFGLLVWFFELALPYMVSLWFLFSGKEFFWEFGLLGLIVLFGNELYADHYAGKHFKTKINK